MRYAPCWPHLASPLLVRAKRGKEREDVGAAERERWPATAPHLGAEEQGQQPAEGGGRGVAAELWGPPPRRRVRSCACAGAEGGEESDTDPAGRAAALAPATAGGSLEMGSSRPSRLCAAPEMGSWSRSSRTAHGCTAAASRGRRRAPESLPPHAEERGAERRRWGGRRCGPAGSVCRSSAAWRRRQARRAVVEGSGVGGGSEGEGEAESSEGKRKGERGSGTGEGVVI
jgi:hypothetical protein